MSTRCTVHFHYMDREDPDAIVYRHGDGYPEGVLPDLGEFFRAVQDQTRDTRFDDPSYLAAKFVVWQAGRYAGRYNPKIGEWEKTEPLDFLSVGVLLKDPGDIEYRYHVHCGQYAADDTPIITWEKVPFE